MFGIIIEETDRLLKLSNNILKLAKLQHQERITRSEQVEISEQIRKAIVLLEPKWREKDINFSVSMENVYFDGDEDLLFQVWVNIIDNSIKFSKQNGNIEVKIEQKDSKIIIKIKDNGIGMETEELQNIYNRFYQIDKSHSGEGSGLGLSIVKRIIDLSNGTIKVESKKDFGTTMIIELPSKEKQNKIVIK